MIITTLLIILKLIIALSLIYLNIKSIKKAKNIPDYFKHTYNDHDYKKNIAYNLDRNNLDFYFKIYGSILLFAWIFFGLNFINNITLGFPIILQFTLLFILFYVIDSILRLPLDLLDTFYLEQKYGFNRITKKIFLQDKLKNLLLTFFLGIPLYLLIIVNIENVPYWWIYAFVAITIFKIVLIIIYPNFIAPLFNKFKQLPDGELKTKLQNEVSQTGFNLTHIFVMDASKRTTKNNAYLTGLFKSKRIVLFDTLIANLNTEELLAVIGHELGHAKKKHLTKLLLAQLLLDLLACYLLHLLFYSNFYLNFVESKNIGIILLLFIQLISIVSFYLNPIINKWSRKLEYEADRFATLNTDANHLINALIKLTQSNMSNITPHPWYSEFYYSHPSILERIKVLESYKF